MKSNLKKAIMPLAVVVLGAATAFATNAVKQNEKTNSFVEGYYYDHNNMVCEPVGDVWCSTNYSTEICEDINERDVFLSDDQGLTCSTLLYKITP